MSALETVKELGRMATTATLSKDVIDLFAQKVDLLEKQVATLEQENASLKTESRGAVYAAAACHSFDELPALTV